MVLDDFRKTIPVNDWSQIKNPWDTFDQLKKVIELLEKIDKKLDQPNCTDPAKAQYLEDVKKVIGKRPKQRKQRK